MTSTHTIIKTEPNTQVEEKKETSNTTVVKLKAPKPKKKVNWTEDTIDNEHMNKLKSNSNSLHLHLNYSLLYIS
jgi:hypothetical protein